MGAKSLAELRAQAGREADHGAASLAGPNTDGYVLPAPPLKLFERG